MYDFTKTIFKLFIVLFICFCLLSIMNNLIVLLHEYEIVNNMDCSIKINKKFEIICKEKQHE